MKKKTMYNIVKSLRAGQPVMLDGHCIRAMRLYGFSEGCECEYCEMDCLCKGEIAEACNLLNQHAKVPYYLFLCVSSSGL